MRYIYLIAITLIIALSLNNKNIANASAEPCTPDCEDTVWVHDQIDVNLQGCHEHCYVTIYYSYRIACGVYQDVQVTSVVAHTTYCNECSIEELYMQALYAVITLNTMDFEPQVGDSGCNYIWRVTAGGCLASWQIYYHEPSHTGDTLTILQKCDAPGDPCCLANMEVCRTPRPPDTDLVTISTISNSYPSYNCGGAVIPPVDTLPPPPDGVECEPICDWFDDVVYQTDKRSYHTVTEIQEIPLYPNPASGEINFDINSPDNGSMDVQIYNLSGNLEKNELFNVSTGWNTISMDIRNMSSGSYYIVININGRNLHTKQFIITGN